MTEPTNGKNDRWTMLAFCLTTFLATLGLIGGYVTITLAPINQSISDLKADIRDIRVIMAPLLTLDAQIKTDDAQFRRIDDALKLKTDLSLHDQFQISVQKEINDNAIHTNLVDGALIKREEISSLLALVTDRIAAVSLNVDALRHDFGSNFTLGDEVKALETRLNSLPSPAAIAPAAPSK